MDDHIHPFQVLFDPLPVLHIPLEHLNFFAIRKQRRDQLPAAGQKMWLHPLLVQQAEG
jgi:hypothetical protein